MQTALSPERLYFFEAVKPRPKQDERDFVAMYGFADEPMAGKRPPKRNQPDVIPLSPEAANAAEPVA